MAGSDDQIPLHVLFFPLMAQGHLIPLTDIAKLFALRQPLRASIVTSPLNAARIRPTVDRTPNITIHLLRFPCSEAGLPDGCETLDEVTSLDTSAAFSKALSLLRHPFKQLVQRLRPDCIVYDMFLPWVVDVAASVRVPVLAFDVSSFFSHCIWHSIQKHSPHESAATESEPFLVPKLPHPIELTRSQLPDYFKSRTPFTDMLDRVEEGIRRSYGVVLNSFYELEPDYVKYYKEEVLGSDRAYAVGPVSLCNRNQEEMAERGKKAVFDPNQCLDWLESREPGSVLYVCFGSLCRFSTTQLMEIALALAASNRPFIWVVRSARVGEWMPDRYEERMKGRGLIIKGWAPQVMILNHRAIGGFVTHCGWNSVLEGMTAGVPMVTWPLFAEQFYNEKLITRVLGTGVEVGARVWASVDAGEYCETVVGREQITRAIERVMEGGVEAEERRERARELSEMTKRAVEKDGSSCKDLDRLIQELRDACTVTKGVNDNC